MQLSCKIIFSIFVWLSSSCLAIGKTEINIVKDDSVAVGTTIELSPVIGDGKTVTMKKFGCMDPAIGDGIDSFAILQFGKDGAWKTIRACTKSTEYTINRDFIGDGVKQFRVIRMNKSAVAKTIVFWIEGLILD